MDPALKLIADNINPYWHKLPVAVCFALFLGAIEYLGILLKTADPTSFAGISVPILTSLGVVGVWWFTHRIPRCPPDKVGIVIAVVADDADEARQIESDFVREIIARFHEEHGASNFHVMVLPPFAAAHVVHDKRMGFFLEKCRGHLILSGFARRRIVDGKEAHLLQLEGAVRHAPLPKALSEAFAREFGEAFPRKLIIPKDGDVFAFEVGSGWIDLSVRYVVAIAAHLSGDFAYAEGLFLSVERRITETKNLSEILRPIARDIPKRLVGLYDVWRGYLARQYFLRREISTLEKTDQVAAKLLDRDPSNYGGLLTRAMCHFCLRRDVVKARMCLKSCEAVQDAAWRYSMAFLSAYEGNLKKAHDEYRKAFRAPRPDPTLALQCEEAILAVVRDEPEKQHLQFCTGLINYNAKEDFSAAKRDFELFLKSPDLERHSWAQAVARDLIGNCDEKNAAAAVKDDAARPAEVAAT